MRSCAICLRALPFFKCHQRSESNTSKWSRSSSPTLSLYAPAPLPLPDGVKVKFIRMNHQVTGGSDSGRAPVHVLCTCCAVRRPPARRSGLQTPQLCSDRLQIEINALCFPPVQKSVLGQFVSMMKPLHPFEVLQIKPSASKHAGAL